MNELPVLDRRAFLGGALAFLLSPAALARAAERDAALEKSPYVYISPLLGDGKESSCHGEVWYGWIDGAVVILTASSSWKARAIDRGLASARIWVGDYGRWKKPGGRNEGFRQAPHFEAKGALVPNAPELRDRLFAQFERKYPDEFGSWREKMRIGYLDGTRVLVRYKPAS
ncbi:MAG: hypothetical protein QF890_07245 [Myxococcota bacterium]|jgi:hypothetical protein|nr:hypothetical protein [Deltaproteobacteria bacterium]MCP4245035.1 hypothetical protein [bacterium]MDP6075603.1 hypothetical protein [Myxococcota bacterium]MDP6242725.1 hypothetical protein [Myxococcota bacterium]MDP7074502.1 hypothetical protein [Myxococcota bacterium]